MTDNPPSSSKVSGIRTRALKANDVLLGRGPGLSNFEGNLRFRKLIDARKHEYTTTKSRKEKKTIAANVRDLVHSRGGRFIKQMDDDDDMWYEACDDVVLEKCKQSLRENREPSSTGGGKKGSSGGESMEQDESATFSVTQAVPSSSSSSAFIKEAPPPQEGVLQRGTEQVEPLPCPSRLMPAAQQGMAGVAGAPAVDTRMNLAFGAFGLAGNSATAAAAPFPEHASPFPPMVPLSNMTAAALHPTTDGGTAPSAIDPRLLLFRDTSFAFNQQLQTVLRNQVLRSQLQTIIQSGGSVGQGPPAVDQRRQQLMQDLFNSASVAAAASRERYLADSAIYSILQDFSVLHASAPAVPQSLPEGEQECCKLQDLRLQDAPDMNIGNCEMANAASDSSLETRAQTSAPTMEYELAAFLLTSLAVTDRPVITNEQEALEREMLTDEEKAAALADAFGKLCEPDVPQKKRARRDLDPSSINFLIRQMKCELERIPLKKKHALIEAQFKCGAEEFSDARLEKFLRCEGMNAKVREL